MTSLDAKNLRREIAELKNWISHWQDDAASKLIPTASSLIAGKAHAENALVLLDRIEAEEKEFV